jgi:hypothetical protein
VFNFATSGHLFHKEGARNLRFPALVLPLGRNRLLFSTALVEWWTGGVYKRAEAKWANFVETVEGL